MSGLSAEEVAVIAHEANAALRRALGEPNVPWAELGDDRQAGVIGAVHLAAQKRWTGPAEMHSEWFLSMAEQGWSYGPVYDPAAKLHPNMVPWAQMPPAQRAKDVLFLAVVRALL